MWGHVVLLYACIFFWLRYWMGTVDPDVSMHAGVHACLSGKSGETGSDADRRMPRSEPRILYRCTFFQVYTEILTTNQLHTWMYISIWIYVNTYIYTHKYAFIYIYTHVHMVYTHEFCKHSYISLSAYVSVTHKPGWDTRFHRKDERLGALTPNLTRRAPAQRALHSCEIAVPRSWATSLQRGRSPWIRVLRFRGLALNFQGL